MQASKCSLFLLGRIELLAPSTLASSFLPLTACEKRSSGANACAGAVWVDDERAEGWWPSIGDADDEDNANANAIVPVLASHTFDSFEAYYATLHSG